MGCGPQRVSGHVYEFRGSSIPAGNCGPALIYICLIDMFVFFTNLCFIYIYNRCLLFSLVSFCSENAVLRSCFFLHTLN
jgi:hypothetical protein